jgi:hypothetical protein
VKQCPNEKRVVKQKDLKKMEKKIQKEDRKEDDKLYKRKRKK